MGSDTRERLVGLEFRSDQHRKELDCLPAIKRDVEALKADLARVLDWQESVSRKARQCGRWALWVAVLAGSHHVSGPWANALGSVAKRLAGGLG